jgi:UDP-perosamine 4-acetyltransferase
MRDRGRPLIIVGAGDQGRVVLELLQRGGDSPVGFVEPSATSRTGEEVDGIPILGDLVSPEEWMPSSMVYVICALGGNRARSAAFARCLELGLIPVTAMHPTATVLRGAHIEPGAVVCAGAVVGVAAWVGPNAVVNTAASIDHDDRIGAHATIAPGAHLGGRVHVEEGAWVGIGASVKEGIRIGAWSVVAGGAVVIRDVTAGQRVAGVPARPMRASASTTR